MAIQETQDKAKHIKYFRERGQEALVDLRREHGRDQKALASAINQAIQESSRTVVNSISSAAEQGKWSSDKKLTSILLATYSSYVAMLELRNEVWPYEYMAFSRRIGELWEGFVRVVFDYAPSGLQYFVPPLFSDVRATLKNELSDYIKGLPLSPRQRTELLEYYSKVWTLVDSGEINLELDLHFELGKRKFNVDLKSGFGSNEKGNTNRLLMVATIYRNLGLGHENVLLVRAPEDHNNHYFRTLQKSGVWKAYCGRDAYSQIEDFTGFKIERWNDEFLDWAHDLSPDLLPHLRANKLLQYLEW